MVKIPLKFRIVIKIYNKTLLVTYPTFQNFHQHSSTIFRSILSTDSTLQQNNFCVVSFVPLFRHFRAE